MDKLTIENSNIENDRSKWKQRKTMVGTFVNLKIA